MFWLAFALSIIVKVVEGFISYLEKTFNDKQLQPQVKTCGHRGQPFIKHGGIWGDFLFISLVIGITSTYYNQWDGKQVILMTVISMIICVIMHTWWARAQMTTPGHIVRNGNITISGLVHFVYMQMALTLVLLFYFCTTKVEPQSAWITTILLTLFLPWALIQPGWMHNNHRIKGFDVTKTILLTIIIWILHFQLLP